MPVEVQVIDTLDFFQDLDYTEIEQFAASLNLRNIAKGDVLLRRGTPALTFFIILSGTYKVILEEGRSYTLDQKGTIIGWSTVIAPFEYTGTAVAETDGNVLYISSHEFFRLIQNNNALGEKLMKKINEIASVRRAFAASNKS